MKRALLLPRHVRDLQTWFARHKRDLPFRDSPDWFAIWISEAMLQQTRVAAMLPRYASFMQRFATVQELARSSEQDVLQAWTGLGYYSRARNLRAAAVQIVADHHGCFPGTIEEAIRLPGVGAYTAAAVLSIAFGAEVPVVDGNVKRVIARLTGNAAPVFEREAETLLRMRGRAAPGAHNQAMMELGALVCLPKNPLCQTCPLSPGCVGLATFGPAVADNLPARRSGRAFVDVSFEIFVPFKKGRWPQLLIMKDKQAPLLSKLYFFPYRTKILEQDGKDLGSGPALTSYATPGLTEFLPPDAKLLGGAHRFRHSITHHRLHAEARLLPLKDQQTRQWIRANPELEWKTVPVAQIRDWLVTSLAEKLGPLLGRISEAKGESSAL